MQKQNNIGLAEVLLVGKILMRGWRCMEFETFGFIFHLRGQWLGYLKKRAEGYITQILIIRKTVINNDKLPKK